MPLAPVLDVTATTVPARLRPVGVRDLPGLDRLLAEPGVAAWWGRWDQDRLRREVLDDKDLFAWCVVDPAHDELLGFAQGWEEADPDYRHAGIDLALTEAARDRGLGTAVVRTLARWFIEQRGHHRLVIDPAADNARAIAAYRKVGFRPVGILRRHERTGDGTWRDGLLLELLADELA